MLTAIYQISKHSANRDIYNLTKMLEDESREFEFKLNRNNIKIVSTRLQHILEAELMMSEHNVRVKRISLK